MAFDLKIEIFAYKWFRKILLGTELLQSKYDVTKVYKDECLAYPECNEASDCDHLYDAIMFRRWLFQKLYLEEIQTQVNEFRHSQTDFYSYVLRTCNRVDLFGNLTIFDRVFATCAFVCCLCSYCCDSYYSEIMRYGHIYWAMYFDNFADEFYKQGGWNRLKMVAVSYKLPIDFVEILQVEESADITLIKIRKAIKSYSRFKKIGEIDHDECISMSWAKFYTQYINGSSDNDVDEFFEEFHSNEIKNCTEIENILKQLKYLCDPTGSEIVKSLSRMTTTECLETSMANLNICDKFVNLESKEETILASELEQNTTSLNLASKSSKKLNAVEENVLDCREPDKAAPTSLKMSSKQKSLVKIGSVLKDDHAKSEYFQLKSQEQGKKTTTVEHLFENMTISEWKGEKDVKKNTILTPQLPSTEKKEDSNKIRYDSKEEHEWKRIKEANKNMNLNEQMSSTEDNAEKKNNKIQNGICNEQAEWKVKGTKRSMSRSGRITPIRKNAEKISSDEAQNDARKEQDKRKSTTKTTIPTAEKNAEMKNSNEIRAEARNEQDECKTIKMKKKSTSSKRRVKKENSNKNQDDIRKEQDELKDIKGEKDNAILTGQMSSTVKNVEEENKSRNSIRKKQEDDDVKNFLRMLLVLGDKQGRCDLEVRCRPRFQVRNPIPLKVRRALGLLNVKSYLRRGQTSSRWCGAVVWREGCQLRCRPRQLTAVSTLRDPSQNSPRVASKRDVNITKLTLIKILFFSFDSKGTDLSTLSILSPSFTTALLHLGRSFTTPLRNANPSTTGRSDPLLCLLEMQPPTVNDSLKYSVCGFRIRERDPSPHYVSIPGAFPHLWPCKWSSGYPTFRSNSHRFLPWSDLEYPAVSWEV
ncbi:hypothetical protein AVEN_117468-1 [Araneus ventricosus]|uniref:Uncharacterized protein n=1 Tax=Araneus ventricosus TaxID=182803 RepID=A0A4Y2HTY5_ARAVE|nr:hypothetical protein AVEN_117468-1 [Araneus ventricosus]